MMSKEHIQILHFFKENNHFWLNPPYVSQYLKIDKELVKSCLNDLTEENFLEKKPNHLFYKYKEN